MLLESIVGAAIIGSTVHNIKKSIKMDEQALKKYGRAFEREEEARQLVRKKTEEVDQALMNISKKKKAIIEYTVPRFVEVYGQIQKIDLEQKTQVNALALQERADKLVVLNSVTISHKIELTDKELVCGLLFHGALGGVLGGVSAMMVTDSERSLSAAKKQMSAANVAYSQAESGVEFLEAVKERALRIAGVLAAMNKLFVGSVGETEKIIEKNGTEIRNYSEYEKGILMTCVNIACAVSDIIDIPVLEEGGQLCAAAIEMLETGEKFLAQMNQMV